MQTGKTYLFIAKLLCYIFGTFKTPYFSELNALTFNAIGADLRAGNGAFFVDGKHTLSFEVFVT